MPSLLPGFEYDLFVSYRQKDNKGDHWVTDFVHALRAELDATFKEDISIYFDANPHDGLLETHDVDASLKEKVRCLVFLPIVSQTYCDEKSFAWVNEFIPFIEQARGDKFGLDVRLENGNVAKRVLPVRIHDIAEPDKRLFEQVLGSVMRPVDFIYRDTGVNRPLRTIDDEVKGRPVLYRDQVNKVALSIKALIDGLRSPVLPKTQINKLYPEIRAAQKSPMRRRLTKLGIAVMILAVVYFAYGRYETSRQVSDARSRLLPEIKKLIDDHTFQVGQSYMTDSRAFFLGVEARTQLGSDHELNTLWPFLARKVSIQTVPSDAWVSWRLYEEAPDQFRRLAQTPVDSISLPNDLVVIRIDRPGYEPIEVASSVETQYKFALDSLHKGMVRLWGNATLIQILGLDQYFGTFVPGFWMDKFEVTNREFKQFMDDGGYEKSEYWKHPIVQNDKKLTHDEARRLFIDRTGRPGPATWEAGVYPSGEENHPVAGVSWYEASAYAVYAGKQLPSVFHWSRNAITVFHLNRIINKGNFNQRGTVPVGTQGDVNRWGCFDMAGNVREWCANPALDGSGYFALGGAYNDPTYYYNESFTQAPLDRSPGNGFRCIVPESTDTTLATLTRPLSTVYRDYTKEKPVDDATFKQLLSHFVFDPKALNATFKRVLDTTLFTVDRIELDAVYGKERQIAYLYLPKGIPAPYQTVVFWPGANAIHTSQFNPRSTLIFDFLVKTGRAVVCPVFKGTYERSDDLTSSNQDNTTRYRGYVVSWMSDIRRLLDYLDTRPDMNPSGYGFYGYSWGGAISPIVLALEPRFKAAVLHVGGLRMQTALPEVDPINFTSRITVPVLMLNGKYDMIFPYESSQKPLHRFLGTPQADKKLIVYDGGHLVPKVELIRETVAWYDRYLQR